MLRKLDHIRDLNTYSDAFIPIERLLGEEMSRYVEHI